MATVEKNLVVAPNKKAVKISEVVSSLSGVVPAELRGVDQHGNDTCVVTNVRLSTAICLHDGNRVLVWGRPPELQTNRNDALDCYGAVAFNNASLPYKLPKDFDAKILAEEVCPGFAAEIIGDETCFMQVSLVKVTPESLQQAVVESKSFLMDIEEVKSSENPKTSKLELALMNL